MLPSSILRHAELVLPHQMLRFSPAAAARVFADEGGWGGGGKN